MVKNKSFMFFVAHLGFGGAQKMATFVMNELVEHGCDVSVVAYYETNEVVKLDGRVRRYFIDLTYVSENVSDVSRHINNMKAIFRFKRVIERINADVAVMFGPDAISNIALRKSAFKGKVIQCERGDLLARSSLHQAVLRKAFASADLAIFQTPNAMKDYGDSIPGNVSIIPNPCLERKDICRESTMLKDKIVSAGRLVPEKGFDILIESFAIVHKRFPNFKLEIYGEGPCRNQLESLIASLSLQEYVCLPGAVDDVAKKYCDARLFVLSSKFEGLPNSLIEAMVLGVPVVATDCRPGGASFLTKNGTIGGPIVPVDDFVSMAKQIVCLLDNTEAAEVYGQKGKSIAYDFSPDNVRAMWMNAFDSLWLDNGENENEL